MILLCDFRRVFLHTGCWSVVARWVQTYIVVEAGWGSEKPVVPRDQCNPVRSIGPETFYNYNYGCFPWVACICKNHSLDQSGLRCPRYSFVMR